MEYRSGYGAQPHISRFGRGRLPGVGACGIRRPRARSTSIERASASGPAVPGRLTESIFSKKFLEKLARQTTL
jgi:hypothetical protein